MTGVAATAGRAPPAARCIREEDTANTTTATRTHRRAGFRRPGFDPIGSYDLRPSFGRPGDVGRGLFVGKGPKGYQRSDERILEDVSDALARNGELDASEIVVQVSAGEVTLDGTVPDRSSKRLAEDLVEDLLGVKHVHNRLRVAAVSGGERRTL